MHVSSGQRAGCCQQFMLLLMLLCFGNAAGHGRLMEPPSRASMWRLGFDTPVNYNDNQLFCGGVGVQYGQNGGKCGVCGDPWNGPRENEAGGKFANGIIVRKYDVGQVINVTVDLTANHKGYFEFRLCPSNNPFQKVTQKCLDKYPLSLASADGKTRYMVPSDGYQQRIKLYLRLPKGVKCRACLLQWKYNAGNSWGKEKDGKECIGCGNQEQFYGCADVAIGYDDVALGKAAIKHPWYFQEEDSVWHYGVVTYQDGDQEHVIDAFGNSSATSHVLAFSRSLLFGTKSSSCVVILAIFVNAFVLLMVGFVSNS